MSNALAMPATDTIVNFIERAARDPSVDVAKLEALLRMQREVIHDQAKRAFSAAMAVAQSEMQPVLRDAVNDHTRSKYAKLETIDREMRPIYTRHGFSVRYGAGNSPREGGVCVTCTVAHHEGYSEEHRLEAPLDSGGARGNVNKPAVQALGSSISYLRRYLLCMVFNVIMTDEDDDGESARVQHPSTSRRQEPRQEHDPTAPEYPLATNQGGRIYRTGSEWLNAWIGYPNGWVQRLKQIGALDKLELALEMNKRQFEAIREFDPQAVADVEKAIADVLDETHAQKPEEAAEVPESAVLS